MKSNDSIRLLFRVLLFIYSDIHQEKSLFGHHHHRFFLLSMSSPLSLSLFFISFHFNICIIFSISIFSIHLIIIIIIDWSSSSSSNVIYIFHHFFSLSTFFIQRLSFHSRCCCCLFFLLLFLM